MRRTVRFLVLAAALGGCLIGLLDEMAPSAWAGDLTFTGKLVCSLKRPVLLPFPGEILSLEVEPGQKVKEGEVLARFRLVPEAFQGLRRRLSAPQITELRAKLAEVDKGLAALKGKERGLKQLAKENLAAPQTLELVERESKALARQQAALQERLEQERQFAREDEALLRKQLGVAFKSGQVPQEGVLTAPISGHVVWMNPELRKGAVLKNDTPVFMVGAMDPMLLIAHVHEIEALKLKVGDPADITLESLPGRTFQAQVARLPWAPTVLNLERPTYYEVEFQIPNPDLVLKEGLKATLVVRQPDKKTP